MKTFEAYTLKLKRLRILARWLKTEYKLEWVNEYNNLKLELKKYHEKNINYRKKC